MNCEEANKVDQVDYLYASGYKPTEIKGIDYCLSSLIGEKAATLKIERSRNVRYDLGAGRSDTVINFVIQFFPVSQYELPGIFSGSAASAVHRCILDGKRKIIVYNLSWHSDEV